jgi:hypothetical protein
VSAVSRIMSAAQPISSSLPALRAVHDARVRPLESNRGFHHACRGSASLERGTEGVRRCATPRSVISAQPGAIAEHVRRWSRPLERRCVRKLSMAGRDEGTAATVCRHSIRECVAREVALTDRRLHRSHARSYGHQSGARPLRHRPEIHPPRRCQAENRSLVLRRGAYRGWSRSACGPASDARGDRPSE